MIAMPLFLLFLSQESFEAASIRPSKAQDNSSGITTSRGGVRTENTSLAALIRYAYKLHSYQIIGASGWMEDLRWDVNARNEDDDTSGGSTGERSRARMRVLLAERFKLRIKEETRELPVYALLADKQGLKIKTSEGSGSTNTNENNGSDGSRAKGSPCRPLHCN